MKKLLLFLTIILTFNAAISSPNLFIEENAKAFENQILPRAFNTYIKIDYQMAPYYYVPIYETFEDITVGVPYVVNVRFRNTIKMTQLKVLISGVNEDRNLLYGTVIRQDHRNDIPYRGFRTFSFIHDLNKDASIIKIRGTDNNTNGPFRLKLNFR